MKVIATCYVFASSSNPEKTHQTLQYIDGSTSCECPGWTRRCVDGFRTCKHVRYIEAGLAAGHCVSKVDYGTRPRQINRAPISAPVGYSADAVKRAVTFEDEN